MLLYTSLAAPAYARAHSHLDPAICLYTTHRDQVYRGEIHHPPWPLQDAHAEFETNTVAAAAGISLPDTAPLLHFARRQDVLIWPLRRADSSAGGYTSAF